METTKSTTETLNEGAKVIEKFFNDANSAWTEMFKKQLDLSTSFYTNLFNSAQGNTNGWNQDGGFQNMFAKMDISKWFSNPFAEFSSTNMQNPFFSMANNPMKQMMEFNQKLLSSFTNGINGKDFNWGEMSEEYKETINTRVEASKEIHNIISKAAKEQLESSMAINKKTMEEINNQMNLVMKQNQKFWTDLLNAKQTSENKEEKKSKDPIMYEDKKRSNVLATDFKDHKK